MEAEKTFKLCFCVSRPPLLCKHHYAGLVVKMVRHIQEHLLSSSFFFFFNFKKEKTKYSILIFQIFQKILLAKIYWKKKSVYYVPGKIRYCMVGFS